MKKFLLFQLVLMLSLPALAEEPFSFETRKVPVNRGGEIDGTVSLRFYKDMPSVPSILPITRRSHGKAAPTGTLRLLL